MGGLDLEASISIENAGSLAGLFRERVKLSPDEIAYQEFNRETNAWEDFTWRQMAHEVARWQGALKEEGLYAGDRVAIMMPNGVRWVLAEQAALGLGLVVVPLFTNDRADNVGYILQHSEVKVLFIHGHEQWNSLEPIYSQLSGLDRVISMEPVQNTIPEINLTYLNQWRKENPDKLHCAAVGIDELATIVYTSGTTGRPKGVMLSHRNILWNAHSGLLAINERAEDSALMDMESSHDLVFLSFLPLSHMLERSVGYFLPMMAGCVVTYARSIPQLGEDLLTIQPHVLVSVPRIYERIHDKIHAQLGSKPKLVRKLFEWAVEIGWQRFGYLQGRTKWNWRFLFWPLLDKIVAQKILEKLGGNLVVSISGGAALNSDIAKEFIGLGLPLLQGYGLTETSPILTANRLGHNFPRSVGIPIPDVEMTLGPDGELLARSPGVMMGYWKNPEATADVIDKEGWFHTGDKGEIRNNRVYITGRSKDIIVMSNGEKVPPADMETAITMDALFEQAVIIGENRPFLSALVVMNHEHLEEVCHGIGLNFDDLQETLGSHTLHDYAIKRIAHLLKAFPGYAKIRKVLLLESPWTVENQFMTPTLKIRRERVMKAYEKDIDALYQKS